MDNMLHIPLDLPDVRILAVSKTNEGEWLIRVESTQTGTHCHRCGARITRVHGRDRPIRVRHLPIFETPVFIEIRPQRYQCLECEGHPTTTQRLSWHDPRSPNTHAYEQWLLRLLVNSTVSDVAATVGSSNEIVTGVMERWVSTEVDWDDFEQIEVLGIDEISLKRGHRHYVSLISTPTPRGVELLGVLADRKQETVAQFFESIPARLRGTIQRVCSDMYKGFVGAVEAQLPGAKLVVDRFHVAKAYRNCADSVRKHELKRLKQRLSKPDYAQLKGAMWPFRKSESDLEPKERTLLERLFEASPRLKQTYDLREELTAIFERHSTKAGAKRAIRAWCKRVRKAGIEEFDPFLHTLETWLDKITNYFLERLSSGFVEGFNNRVKVLKRRCYGIFTVEHIFQRLTLDLHGYEGFEVT